jgi:hypothetical protein
VCEIRDVLPLLQVVSRVLQVLRDTDLHRLKKFGQRGKPSSACHYGTQSISIDEELC